MKEFVSRSLIFLLFPILYLGFNITFNVYHLKKSKIVLKSKNILIAGDSYPQKSLNPILFNSALNISQYAEPYVLTFWKLKKIFELNKPDTLILGFAPHNISAFNDHKFSNQRWASEMFKRCLSIENFESIDKNIDVDYYEYYKTVLKQIGFYPKYNHVNYIGEYTNYKKSNITDWRSTIRHHFYMYDKELGISSIAIQYLDSIITICKNNKIVPILISTPVHLNYQNNIPSNIETTFTNLSNKYDSSLTIIDKTDEIFSDSLFLNSNHLNSYGADKFTKQVIKELKMTSK